MRIIAGSARGRSLTGPKGNQIRPTSDRVRQSVFNILGQTMEGERVLDLYAGTGALALEALSRGATFAVLVDSSPDAAALCRTNAEDLGFLERVDVLRSRVEDAVSKLGREKTNFSLVFADPPYAENACARTLQLLDSAAVLLTGSRVLVEHSKREESPERLGRLLRYSTRRFGDTVASFYQSS